MALAGKNGKNLWKELAQKVKEGPLQAPLGQDPAVFTEIKETKLMVRMEID